MISISRGFIRQRPFEYLVAEPVAPVGANTNRELTQPKTLEDAQRPKGQNAVNITNLPESGERQTVKTDEANTLGIDDQKHERPQRGRKPAYESRAAELRQKLTAWKETPESKRPSLRALARQNNTSHQLLAFYLKGLEEWQQRERYRTARRRAQQRAEEIRAQAAVEKREMTLGECLDAIVGPGFDRAS